MVLKIGWIHLIIGAFLISQKIFSACGNSMYGDMAAQSSLRPARAAEAEWNNYRLPFPQRNGERMPLRHDWLWSNLGHEFRAEDDTESLHHNKREAVRPTAADLRMIDALLRELQAGKEKPKKYKRRRKKKKMESSKDNPTKR